MTPPPVPSVVRLEPELDWSVFERGGTFPAVAFTLDDASIDAYLRITGEAHPAYDADDGGLAPPLYTSLVRLVKASIGGRWPSGTLQLDHRIEMRRALRRGESLTLVPRIENAEQRGGRRFVSVVSSVFDARGEVVLEQRSSQMWAGAVRAPDREVAASAGASGAASVGTPRATSPDPRTVADPVPAASAAPAETAARLGPITARFDLATVRAFGSIAGAIDPIHVDPDFALGTRWGRNIVQGRLAMTLAARLALQRFGEPWLERGWLALRFVRPVMVDEPVTARGVERADGSLEVWCENARGERAIDGTAGRLEASPRADVDDATGGTT